ncbi:MAG TPA: YbaN family protein [Gammaproteobacteria bacterium]
MRDLTITDRSNARPEAGSPARGLWRMLLLVAGWTALVLGIFGVILPILPTAPFLLLAVACFSRSSPEMAARIHRLPLAGRYLRDWQEQGISPGMKWAALAALWVTAGWTLAVVAKTVLLKVTVLIVAVLTSVHFLVMPVRRKNASEDSTRADPS